MVRYSFEHAGMSICYGLDRALGLFLDVNTPKWPEHDDNASKEYNEVVKRIEGGETEGKMSPFGIGIKVTLHAMVEFMQRYKVPEHHILEFAEATDPEKLEAEYRRVLPLMKATMAFIGDAEGLRQTGNQQFQKGSYGKAIESYTQSFLAETDDEKKAVVLSNRAQAYLNLEIYDYALEDADRALMSREAIAELQNLLERNPADSNTYSALMQQAITVS
uniref:Tetratricopeptide repeat protein n=1 Tax=Ditylenchus dipsaci TaxID=166011 RepID=A0A915DBI2_9BILA